MRKILKLNKEKIDRIRNGESGFSLIEMLISITLFLMVTGTIWGLLRVAGQSRTTVNNHVQLDKNVRIGLNVLGRDAWNAGYNYPLKNSVVLPDNRIAIRLGLPNDFDNARDTVPPVMAGNNITLNTFNTTAGVRTDQVTFLFKDPTFNLTDLAGTPGDITDDVSVPLNIGAVTTGTGFNQVIPLTGSNSACRANDLFLITGGTGSTLGLATSLQGANGVRFANGDLLGFNLVGSLASLDGIATPAVMQRVQMVTYFVTADGILTRREFGNVTPAVASVDEPLVYGVENFQIQYVMDDGTLSDNPSAGVNGIPGDADDAQANLAAIRQVRFTISVRSTELDQNNQPRRLTMTSTFSTKNLGYSEE